MGGGASVADGEGGGVGSSGVATARWGVGQ